MALLAGATLALPALGGCGGKDQSFDPLSKKKEGKKEQAAPYPMLATRNSTRIPGRDATEDAVFAARAAYPATDAKSRPNAVTLVSSDDWQAAVAASVLVHSPVNAPLLLTTSSGFSDSTKDAFKALRPKGFLYLHGHGRRAARFQAIRVGSVPIPDNLTSTAVTGKTPFEIAARIDDLASQIAGKRSESVVVVSASKRSYALPAAPWAAKSGTPVLFVRQNSVPEATKETLRRHKKPRIFILGPERTVSKRTLKTLRRFGPVTRVAADTAVKSAIAFARFRSFGFGWGVIDPGHGLVFINQHRPLDIAAASVLSSGGEFGPLLLLDQGKRVPSAVRNYLLDIQPGYRLDPVRGVYNHAWLVGDTSAISLRTQAAMDRLNEIKKIKSPEPGKTSGPDSIPGPSRP